MKEKNEEVAVNKYGVPHHDYEITTLGGDVMTIDVGCEDDWGNVQECFTDWDGKNHRKCVGWGNSDEWSEITGVVDLENGNHLKPLYWAENFVWNYVDNYSC